LQKEASEQERKDNAKILAAYEHYFSLGEAWAEASARVLFPPENKNNRNNFESIFENVFALAKAKLIAEGLYATSAPDNVIETAPLTGAQTWPNPAPSGFETAPFTGAQTWPNPPPSGFPVHRQKRPVVIMEE